MTSPEEAMRLARQKAGPAGPGPLGETFVDDVPDLDTIAEWAVIDVPPDVLYSARRFGGPVTGVKRLLLRLLRQYHVEVEARQTRFNIALLARLRLLEERLDSLEHSPRE